MITSRELLNAYQLGRKSLYQAVDGILQDDAEWKPADNVKSIQELLVHIGGAERFWLGKLNYEVLDFPKSRQLEDALEFVRNMEALLTQYVHEATQEQFNQMVTTDRGELSLAWVIKRVTQHMFYHLGTFVYLRSIRQPDWDGEAGLSYWQNAVDTFSSLVITG